MDHTLGLMSERVAPVLCWLWDWSPGIAIVLGLVFLTGLDRLYVKYGNKTVGEDD